MINYWIDDTLRNSIQNANPLTYVSAKKTISIIILNWNSLDLLIRCLTLINQTTSVHYTMIIVDNGSTDGSQEYLRLQKFNSIYNDYRPNFKILLNKTNLGFAKGVNLGIKNANENDDIILMNVDAEPQSRWLEELLVTQKKYFAGIVGPLGNNLPSKYQSLDSVEHDTQVTILIFYCVLISRKVIDKIGLLDERYGLGGYEDNDYCFRTVLARFNNFISAKSTVLHEPHQVTKMNGLPENLFEKNRDVFSEKFYAVLMSLSKDHYLYNDNEFAKRIGLFID